MQTDITRRVAEHIATQDNEIIVIFCIIAVLIVLYPIWRFLQKHWDFRRERLFGFLAGGAVIPYYSQFRPGNLPPNEQLWTKELLMDAFRSDFYRWYGRRHYVVPLLLLTAVTVSAAVWGVETLRVWSISSVNFKTYRGMTGSALAGGFAWVIWDELDRLRRRDFVVSDIYYYVFRILVCVPIGISLSFFANENIGAALAFLLGAFPTATLFTIARRVASQQLKSVDDPASGKFELEKLRAVSRASAERLNDEGITSINALAKADPIDLTIRTNFDFGYVVSCVSQAISFTYLGESAATLPPLAMQGACEIATLMEWLGRPSEEKFFTAAARTIADASTVLKISEDSLTLTLMDIASNSYTQFLLRVGA